jgi:hypothetical protein
MVRVEQDETQVDVGALIDRLQLSLAVMAPMFAARRALESVTQLDPGPDARMVDGVRLQLWLKAVKPYLKRVRERRKHNPWSMATVGHDELRNCSLLSQLWNERSVGPIARRFLAAYFDRIDCGNSILPSLADLAQGYTVRTEHCPAGEQSDRVDITVEGKDFLVGIEVKIHASEGPDQLKRYCKVIASRAHGMGIPLDRQCVVFLAPYPTEVPGVLQSSWRDVAAVAHEVTRSHLPADSTPAWMIQCFGEHVKEFFER